MQSSVIKTLVLRAVFRAPALAAALALACAPAAAQHEGHRPTPQPTATPGRAEKTTPPATQTPPAPQASPAAPQHDPAQHEHHHHATPAAETNKTEATQPAAASPPAPTGADAAARDDHAGHTPESGDDLMVMSGEQMGVRVGASATNWTPMGQMGSGTSWQPASTRVPMWHKRAGDWLLMLHGEAKLGVNSQGGPRGVTKFESQNWLMPMAFRRVGRGTLQLRGMFSLEPLTFSGAGSPQIFQAGEVYQGRPLRDFQHPHDLLMELSAQYTLPLGERATWYAYVGYPGEPALGPTAFMHRAAASENTAAPLAHHLQDATHITFGVFTTGLTYRWLKLEGSVFNGREPDEHRYGFEAGRWDSRSARVTVAPNQNWAVQYSYGLLKNPEQLAPGDVHRQTASVQYNRPLARGQFSAALIWGRNREEHDGDTFRLNSYTAEATLNFLSKNYLYTRLELVDREGDDLFDHEELHDLGFGEGEHPQFRIGAYTLGAARDLWENDKWSVALGGDFTFYSKPQVLDAPYGRHPTSYKLFIRIRPGRARHAGHGGN